MTKQEYLLCNSMQSIMRVRKMNKKFKKILFKIIEDLKQKNNEAD